MTAREWTKATAAEAEQVLKAHFGDRLMVKRGNASYTDTNCTVKFTFAQISEDGTVLTADREDFVRRAKWTDGIEVDDFGRTFKYRGETYEIVGWNARAKKFPIKVVRADGKNFKFPLDIVVARLAAEKV